MGWGEVLRVGAAHLPPPPDICGVHSPKGEQPKIEASIFESVILKQKPSD